jgi:uncharacterized protein YjeT (DUF2065 family)
MVIGLLLIVAAGFAKKRFPGGIIRKADLKKTSIFPIIVGILFLFAAPYNRFTAYVTVLGVVAVIRGILTLVATGPCERLRDWWFRTSDNVRRLSGVIAFAIGLVLLLGM